MPDFYCRITTVFGFACSGDLFPIDEGASPQSSHFWGLDDADGPVRCGCTQEWLSLFSVDGLGTRRQTSFGQVNQ